MTNRAKDLQEKVLTFFTNDTSDHELIVLRDDDLYKHLRFKKPGTGSYRFDLVTWPGYLCFCGDMGTLVFTRNEDMLQFFRDNPDRPNYRINPDYWSQKLCDEGGRSVRQFDRDTFRDNILERISTDWSGLDDHTIKELTVELEQGLLSWVTDPHEAYEALNDFSFDHDGGVFRFEDAYDMDHTQYEFRFLWGLYGIVKCIEAYDAHLAAEVIAEAKSAAIDMANAGA